MRLENLSPAPGSTREVKRVGRGMGSGNGKTAGRGHKGQKSRAGGGTRAGFEGGQMPLQRRIPKRGFNNIFAKKYAFINVEKLNLLEDGIIVDAKVLIEAGLIKRELDGVKVLGNGELERKLTVRAAAFSETAKQKIEAAGGKAELTKKAEPVQGAEVKGAKAKGAEAKEAKAKGAEVKGAKVKEAKAKGAKATGKAEVI